MFNIKNIEKEDGFSLVEILVALIAVSCISAALAPVITKKLKGNAISIGGGGIGGKMEAEFTMDCSDFSADCTMCYDNKCVLCTKDCTDNEYVNTPDCTCAKCTDKDPNCIQCNSKKCTKCAENYGLNLSTRKCYLCTNGQSSDGMSECADCPENYFCIDGTKTPCATNQFAPINSTSCTNCTDKWEHCAKCNPRECLECEETYRKKSDGTCIKSIQTEIFTTPGNHTFTVPGGVTEMEVTLVSGGAGGGAGAIYARTQSFVIDGDANIVADSNNIVTTSSTGKFTWTIPNSIKGKEVLVSACGGGGGAGGGTIADDIVGNGGDGGAIKNVAFTMPNQSTIEIHIGGGGGGGADDDQNNAKGGNCSLGGGGGQGSTAYSSSCNASGNWGKGGWGNGGNPGGTMTAGFGGYDPLNSEHGAGGGNGGSAACSDQWKGYAGGNGSKIGGGGGGAGPTGPGGGGGAATLFYVASYSTNANIIAPGGGGGAGAGLPCSTGAGGAGGGGGGIGGGNGGNASAGVKNNGSAGRDSNLSIFGNYYCKGAINPRTSGKNGAMRISYTEKPNGGTGGGSAQIVPRQKIQVTPGDILTITVGAGGAGGTTGYYDSEGVFISSTNGEGANSNIISKITDGSGQILITTATSVSNAGATGGNPDGTTVGEKGYITTGFSTSQIVVDGFNNTDGEVANSTTGGDGGKTRLEGKEMHCSPGAGGTSETAGSDAIGYGGCGGGGGGAGANGGKGAGGYVKITYES